MPNLSLSFGELRTTNVRRCEQAFGHSLDNWNVAEWGNALQGETGEAIGAYINLFLALMTANKGGEAGNLAKKMLRFRDGIEGNLAGKTIEEYQLELAHEVAGMVIYADLWMASQGLDLGEAVRDEFNSKSDQLNSSIKL